jgi:hypothetical protein
MEFVQLSDKFFDFLFAESGNHRSTIILKGQSSDTLTWITTFPGLSISDVWLASLSPTTQQRRIMPRTMEPFALRALRPARQNGACENPYFGNQDSLQQKIKPKTPQAQKLYPSL